MRAPGLPTGRWVCGVAATVFALVLCAADSLAPAKLPVLPLYGGVVPGSESVDYLEAPIVKLATDDGLAAIRLVRAQAARWEFSADRIGIIGFSAGARVAMGAATTYDAASRPDFVASIYGAVPEGASVPIYEAWRKAGRDAELHVFAKGGHGFGMNRQITSSDRWPEAFGWWLDSLGWLKPAGN